MNEERMDLEDPEDQLEVTMSQQMQEIKSIRNNNSVPANASEKVKKKVKTKPSGAIPAQKQEVPAGGAKEFKKTLKNIRNFEEYRNNTSYFEMNEEWLGLVNKHYQQSQGRKVLQQHQFETVMYMAGQFMGGRIYPRGLLLFHVMGSGKTLTNIASGFYCLSRVPVYTDKSKIIFICNKALQMQIQAEVVKYIQMLNNNKIDETFQPASKPLIVQDYLDKCVFITFNDSLSLNQNLMKGFDVIQNAFVVFDEVHNLFKSISNDSSRGKQVYHHLMSKHLQIQFNSGTPFSSDLSEIGICFNILSGNPDLFPVSSLNSLFVQASPEADEQMYIKNKQVLMRRMTGLVSSAEINIDNEHFPEMKPLQVVNVPVAPEYLQLYLDTRKKNLKSQQFMSDSHLLDNAYVTQENKIISSKFAAIKTTIELDPAPQIIYSQFVQKGSILFADYCLQENKGNSKFTWRIFDVNRNQEYNKPETEITLALIHGLIEHTERTKILSIFNSPENVNGALINVICLSKASVEGINIKYVRKVHIMEAQWESRDLQQVMSRGQRMYSHSLLPANQRVIKPYIYISYTFDQKYTFTKDLGKMSTDQQIFFKQQSLVSFQNTLFTLLHFVSFNCQNLSQFAFLDQLFRPDFHKACFKCESDNKQLFNPKFIHQDITVNNCKTPSKKTSPLQFEFQGMDYGIFVDLYAPYGFTVFELRDQYRRPLDERKPRFLEIFRMAKELVIKQSKRGMVVSETQETQQENPKPSYHTTKFMPYIICNNIKELKGVQIQQIHDSTKVLNVIRASNINFNMHMFNQFQIFVKLEPKSSNHSADSQEHLKLFDLIPKFAEQSAENKPDYLNAKYVINQTQFTLNEFIRRIIKPFYIYLIEYVYVDIRIQIKEFFRHYNQLIIYSTESYKSGQSDQFKQFLDILELKLHKSLIRTIKGNQ